MEDDYLWYFKQNQDKFRRTANKLVRKIVANNPNAFGRIVRWVVLPFSVTGGKLSHATAPYRLSWRWHLGTDLFITFTCNPKVFVGSLQRNY